MRVKRLLVPALKTHTYTQEEDVKKKKKKLQWVVNIGDAKENSVNAAIEAFLRGKRVFASLPTDFGKSYIKLLSG